MLAAVASKDGDGETIIQQLLEDSWTEIASGLWVKGSMSAVSSYTGVRAYREISR